MLIGEQERWPKVINGIYLTRIGWDCSTLKCFFDEVEALELSWEMGESIVWNCTNFSKEGIVNSFKIFTESVLDTKPKYRLCSNISKQTETFVQIMGSIFHFPMPL